MKSYTIRAKFYNLNNLIISFGEANKIMITFAAVIRKNKHILIVVGLLLLAFLVQRCANAVAPTGGPKDERPPVVVEAVFTPFE